jgi:hypothetical protein
MNSHPVQAEEPKGGERFLAIYLPGVYFTQLERKVELGTELANYLAERLGAGYRLTPRVYASIEPMDADADAGRVVFGLLESPLVAARLLALLPVSVATSGGSAETRLLIMAAPAVKGLSGLQSTHLVHATALDKPQAFFDNFVFDGELSLAPERLTSTRDVASALSLASLKKADALVLYEDDEALGRNDKLRTLYRTTPLPRPTLVAFDRRLALGELQRLHEALEQFRGHVQPGLQAFHATSDAPYQDLRTHMAERPRRLPALVELTEDPGALPLPRTPRGSTAQVPLSVYAVPLDSTP